MGARHQAGQGTLLQDNAVVGLEYAPVCSPTVLGDDCIIRMFTIIYADCILGDDVQTGHHVLIREKTRIGSHVVIGTHTIIDGNVAIGDFVKIESNCYVPTHTIIGSRVFLGPNVTLTNDRYPLKRRDQYKPEGPILEDGVTLGAGVVVVPGVRIGHDSFVAASAVVTKDVPPLSLVVGVPGRIMDLQEGLRERNLALSWRKYLNE